VKHPAQVHERDRIQRAATQRMSSPGYPYRARQRPAQMLQSVAYLVGVGKTHLATALGHIAIRRRRTVVMARADKLFKRLTAARLDNTLEAEYRRLAAVELLIIDDFALQPLTPAQTTDFYEIITERHRRASTVVTSNRDASEWLPLMTDPLLAQSAIDRLTSTCHELIVEGDSYRRRQRPPAPQVDDPAPATP
jgi:DNA replication protein DnaC